MNSLGNDSTNMGKNETLFLNDTSMAEKSSKSRNSFKNLKDLRSHGLKSILTSKFNQLNNLPYTLGLESKDDFEDQKIAAINRITAPLNIRNSTRIRRESALFIDFASMLSNLGDKKLDNMISKVTKNEAEIPGVRKLEKEYKKKKLKEKMKKNKRKKNKELFLLRKHGGLLDHSKSNI